MGLQRGELEPESGRVKEEDSSHARQESSFAPSELSKVASGCL